MGLACSPGTFSAGYTTFNDMRWLVSRATGGMWPPLSESDMQRFREMHSDEEPNPNWWYLGKGFSAEAHKGLVIFLSHSDCDGEIGPKDCVLVARDLQSLRPAYVALADEVAGTSESWVELLDTFIEACQIAADKDVPLRFH